MRRLRTMTFWWCVFAVIALAGLYSTAVRIFGGLGASTGLSDAFPWGIWIGFDVLCGVGLAAGGFTVAAMVYVFRIERFRPILRATVLTAFLGYVMVTVSLLFDVGLPYRIWHPMVFWNPHSVMFEVAWCVMFYTNVLLLEFSPVIFERLGMKAPLRLIHTVILPLVILGVVLSTLHQSSLGTLFVIVPNKLHGLWYTSLLPVLFFISAVSVGLAMTIFESYLSHRAFGTRVHRDILGSLAKGCAAVLGVYATAKLTDLALRGNLHLLLEHTVERDFFLLEMGIGVVAPILLFAVPRVRRSDTGLFIGALLVICGFVLNRLDVSITGMLHHEAYFPAWTEVATSVFIVACGFVAFGLAARYLPVFASEGQPAAALPTDEAAAAGAHAEAHDEEVVYVPLTQADAGLRDPTPAQLVTLPGIGILLALAAFLVANTLIFRNRGEAPGLAGPFARAPRMAFLPGKVVLASESTLNLPRPHTFPVGYSSPGQVTFSHEGHVGAAKLSCSHCHSGLFPMIKGADPRPGTATMELMRNCTRCHDGQTAFTVHDGCSLCHLKTKPSVISASTTQMQPPPDYPYTRGPGSPGPVLFSHTRHLSAMKASCTDCHPGRFRMLRPDRGHITRPHMGRMHTGHECGGCHNGRQAFTVTKDCGLCHRKSSAPTLLPVSTRQFEGPSKLTFENRPGSPGRVVFRHAAHVRGAGGKCTPCHPALFSMHAATRSLSMGDMRAGRQCGGCHNGRASFTVARDCALCHQAGRAPAAVPVVSAQVRAPADYAYPVGKNSPGPVRFSHARHARATGGECSACHSTLFPMSRMRQARMDDMRAGRQCGGCHNGRKSFTVAGDCGLCHRMGSPAPAQPVASQQRKPPADYVFARTDASPGPVTFSHARHVANGRAQCSDCHPSVFGMLVPAKADGAANKEQMLKGKGCGNCHNGTKAFTVAGDCALCHTSEPRTAASGG